MFKNNGKLNVILSVLFVLNTLNGVVLGQLKCYVCNSNGVTGCEKNDAELSDLHLEDCGLTDTSCLVYKNDPPSNFVIRGCSDSNFCADKTNCIECSTTECNKMAPESIECYTCQSTSNTDECATVPTTNTLPKAYCDSCSSWFHTDGSIRRGCTSEVGECDTKPNCETCTTPLCNKDKQLSCVSCLGGVCNPGSSSYTYCGQFDDGIINQCYTVGDSKTLEYRGCMSESSTNLGPISCAKPNGACKKCFGSDCNIDIAQYAGNCYSCKTPADSTCVSKPATSSQCTNLVNVGQNMQCFTWSNDIKVERGCYTEQPESFKTECTNNIKKCDVCEIETGPNCNTNTYVECYSCTSAADGNCATLQDTGALNVEYCDKCYTWINTDGSFSRGCRTNVGICSAANNCKECSGNLCNDLKELVCNSCTDDQCSTTIDKKCGKLEDKDTNLCYSVGVSQSLAYRGCTSEPSSSIGVQSCALYPETCKTCKTSNCNDDILQYTGNCYECESGTPMSNANCFTKPLLQTQCTILTNVGEKVQCYTVRDGLTIQRGCLKKETVEFQSGCASNPNKCAVCDTSSNCNTKAYIECYSCTSAADGNCATLQDTGDLNVEYCDKCYTWINTDGSFSRGCRTNIAACSPVNNCKECTGNLCNDLKELVCNSCTDDQCATTIDKKCGKLEDKDTNLCYSVGVSQSLAYRGCTSEPSSSIGVQSCALYPETCKTCKTSNCNDDILQYTGNCYECESGTPMSNANCFTKPLLQTQCTILTNVGEKVQCYTVRDGLTIQRGCLKKETVDFQSGCASNPNKCAVCDTSSNCNTKAYIECYSCNSEYNDDCATLNNANTLQIEYCDKCYDWINSNNIIQRGCRSNIAVCNEINNCHECSSGLCNLHKQLSCLSCADNLCSVEKSIEKKCGKFEDMDMCYSIGVTDSLAYRGCFSDTTNPGRAACLADQPNCALCAGAGRSNCNDRALHRIASCYTCTQLETSTALDCFNKPLTQDKCEARILVDKEFQCYIAYEPNAIIQRGCYSSTDQEFQERCDASTNCKKCSTSDNCNKEVYKPECYTCDSVTNPKCTRPSAIDLSTFTKTTCNAYDKCVVMIDYENVIRRGCYSLDFDKECTDHTCKICENSLCNIDSVTVSDTCYKCESSDPNCKTNVGSFIPITCLTDVGKITQCYHKLVGDNVERGCANSLTPTDLTECQGENCKLCNGMNCNQKSTFQKCISCDSSKAGAADADCVTGGTNEKTCTKYTDQCVTFINAAGHTIRGCLEDVKNDYTLPDTCTSTTCSICSVNNCNNQIFPEDRLSCHQCDATNTECQKELQSTSVFYKLCNIYKQGDKCYSLLKEDKFERGCINSASSTSITACNNNPDKCPQCTNNGCNVQLAKKDAVLKCVKCGASEEEACKWAYRETEVEKCTNDVTYGQKEQCYMANNAGAILRGCTLDENPDCTADIECEHCDSDGCNNIGTQTSKCIVCETDTSENCNDNPKSFTPTECETEQFYDNRGCYTLKEGDLTIGRGCFSTLSDEDKETCKNKDDKTCDFCLTDGCNNSLATSLQIMAALIMIAPFIVIFN